MTAIDQRIAVRRRTVREAGARRRLGRLVISGVFVITVGLVALLLQSPVMAVSHIEVTGASKANVIAIMESHGVVDGVATIAVRPEMLVEGIEADPWVAKAQATIRWPDTVAVVVLEHRPVAWVEIGEEWHRVSGTGAVLEQSQPTKRGARVVLRGLSGQPGTILKGKRPLAALEFLANLPAETRRRAVVTGGGDGTLIARVKGHLVDLGSPVDMPEKAATLLAILEQGIPKRSAISLVSPSRPAIRNLQQAVEG